MRPIPEQLLKLWRVRAAGLGECWDRAAGGDRVCRSCSTLPVRASRLRSSATRSPPISITVLTGYGGQISFGQWAFVGFGALFGAALVSRYHVPFLAGLVLAPLAGAAVAVVVGLPALRIRGVFLGVTTLAFAVAANAYIFNWHFFASSSVPAADEDRRDRPRKPAHLLLLLPRRVGRLHARRAEPSPQRARPRTDRGPGQRSRRGVLRDRSRACSAVGVRDLGLPRLLGGLPLPLQRWQRERRHLPAVDVAAALLGGDHRRARLAGGRGRRHCLLQGHPVLPARVGAVLCDELRFAADPALRPGGLASIIFATRDALLRRYARARGIRIGGLDALRREQTQSGAPAIQAAAHEAEPRSARSARDRALRRTRSRCRVCAAGSREARCCRSSRWRCSPASTSSTRTRSACSGRRSSRPSTPTRRRSATSSFPQLLLAGLLPFIFGYVGDHTSRVWLTRLGAMTWIVTCLLTGIAGTLLVLAAVRSFAGFSRGPERHPPEPPRRLLPVESARLRLRLVSGRPAARQRHRPARRGRARRVARLAADVRGARRGGRGRARPPLLGARAGSRAARGGGGGRDRGAGLPEDRPGAGSAPAAQDAELQAALLGDLALLRSSRRDRRLDVVLLQRRLQRQSGDSRRLPVPAGAVQPRVGL